MIAERDRNRIRTFTPVMKRPASAGSARILLPVDGEGHNDNAENDDGITEDQIRHLASILIADLSS